jgi:membrane dipeptidase
MRETFQQIDLIHRLADIYPEHLKVADSSTDILRIFKRGQIAGIISIEGLHQIGNCSSVLRSLHRLGIKCATLTHNRHNIYADCAVKNPVHHGLSQKGKEIIQEMNRVGM